MKQTNTLAQVANYRPVLEKVASGFTPTGNDAHLLRFLASDLLDALKEDNESDEEGETVAVVVLTFIDTDSFKKAQRFFDSNGPSQFWASDWDEQARTIEFVEGNDPDALGAALIEEMQAERITGYTWQAFRQNID